MNIFFWGLCFSCCFWQVIAVDIDKKQLNKEKIYLTIQSGYAWMKCANISGATVSNGWDSANEGYNARLSDAAFLSFAVGVNLCSFLRGDLSYGMYQPVHYEKYQTGESSTSAFTGNRRMRFFDLDHKNALINFYVFPRDNDLSIQSSLLRLFPYIGWGIGVGLHQVGNFHTIAYSGLDNSYGVGTVTTIGCRCHSSSFAWQFQAGLTFASKHSPLAFDVGYRYYNGGKFRSTNRFMANTPGINGDYVGNERASLFGTINSNQFVFTLRFDF